MKGELLQEYLNEEKIEYLSDFSTASISFLEVGGNAKYLIFPKSIKELCNLLCFIKDKGIKFFIVGNGSNVFFNDDGYIGAIISTRKLDKIRVKGDKLIAMCGALVTDCSVYALKNNLSGMEFLFGIPGSVGGAIFMNSSAYERDMSGVVLKSIALDLNKGKLVTFDVSKHEFSPKRSIFSTNRELVLLSTTFQMKRSIKQHIKSDMLKISSKRILSQPLEFGSCGSTFKRPQNLFASKLIDQAKFKGKRIGGAKISKKHAGFIVNYNNASAKDILNLIAKTRKVVLEKFNVLLEQEIIYVE